MLYFSLSLTKFSNFIGKKSSHLQFTKPTVNFCLFQSNLQHGYFEPYFFTTSLQKLKKKCEVNNKS